MEQTHDVTSNVSIDTDEALIWHESAVKGLEDEQRSERQIERRIDREEKRKRD